MEKLFNHHLMGALLGVFIGSCFPLEAYKGMLVLLSVVVSLKALLSK